MSKFKEMLKKIFFLPTAITLLISVPSFALVIYSLTAKNPNPVTAYISYILSAYALTIMITCIIRLVKSGAFRSSNIPLIKNLYKIPLGKRYFTDYKFRAKISLYSGLAVNITYVILNLISGITSRSFWFISLSFYYLLLSVLRASLLHFVIKKPVGTELVSEYRRYRFCGILLLIMNLALGAIVFLMVYKNKGKGYDEYFIYIIALYTFYSVILAVVNLVKYRKLGSPVLSAVKAVSFTAALVSLLSLETAMIIEFGAKDGEEFRTLMTSLTGGGICVVVLGMAVFMIIKANRYLKKQ